MSDRKLMGVPGGQLEDWLKDNLDKSKGNYVRWGRMVLRAIDVDDGLALIDIFTHRQKDLGADINAQTTIRGYEGHIWSAWLHNHIGDTALHIALKQKRMLCVYALLLSNCDITIRNEHGETVNDISMNELNLPIGVLQNEARVGLSPCIDPRSFHQLPDDMLMRNVEQEALHLLDYGRCCYLELPQSAKHDLASSTSNPYALGVENNKAKVKAKRRESKPQGETLCDKVSDEHLKNSLLLQKEVNRELTSGEVAVGNVWGSNDITDVVRMLDNQMNRRRRIDRDNELRQSGLGLLSVLKSMDSAAVNATFATGKSALSGGPNPSVGDTDTGDGLTIASGEGNDAAEKENHANEDEPNYRDRTPFTMDRLPSHVRESKGSMAGIAKLKFLQLNQEKATVGNEFAAIKFEEDQTKKLPGGKKAAKSGAAMLAEAGMRAAEVEPGEGEGGGEEGGEGEEGGGERGESVADLAQVPDANANTDANADTGARTGTPEPPVDVAEAAGGDAAASNVSVPQKAVSFAGDEALEVSGGGLAEAVGDVPPRDIRTPTASDLQVGTAVEAKLHGRGKWFRAKITRCRRNGTYDIEYDDGEEESKVVLENLKLLHVEEEKVLEREPIVFDESNFVKVATDIPVVKSRNIFSGLLYSTANSVPDVQLKLASSLTRSQELYGDDGDNEHPEVRMIQDDMDTGRSRQSSGRTSQGGNAPGNTLISDDDGGSVLKGQIPGAIPGVTADVLHANKMAGHNTDEYLGLVSVKEITHLSTFSNMKYMKVGDDGLIALADILNDDYLVRSMMLDHAHIASRGLSYFSKKLYTMSALMYLDLSQNAIDDDGALDLAVGLEKCMFVSYSTYQRKCHAEQLDTSANTIVEGGTVVGGMSIPSFNNDSGMADGSNATQFSDYYADYSKKLPLTTLVLRANRITDKGVEALMKVVYKLNTVANGLDSADTNSLDLYVCSTTHKTPLAKYLGDKLTREAPPLTSWKSNTANGFGLKRPEKKFYPRNPLKKAAPPAANPESVVPALIPISSDTVTPKDSCFVTNTSKIKAALLPTISAPQHRSDPSGAGHGHHSYSSAAAAHVVQFYLK